VVGAALESPVSFRVWWCSTEKKSSRASSSSSRVSPRVQLHKTLPFACATGSEASACVQRVRQGAAWQGRDSAPRVAAIINPISGQGR
jgi:sphingosine kinase